MNISFIGSIIKKYLTKSYASAFDTNIQNIESALLLTGPHRTLLDVGCWDGKWTNHWGKISGAKKLLGIEPVKSAAVQAASNGIKTFNIYADKHRWPIPSNTVDCIVTDQVIEHLNDVDKFFAESARVLSPGGVIITSTNNLSSFHNLFALAMGWTPFDLANCSYRSSSLGNPLSLHIDSLKCDQATWVHKCVYTAYCLNEWQKIYHLHNLQTYGAGLYPFPSSWGKVFKTHSAFITTVCKK